MRKSPLCSLIVAVYEHSDFLQMLFVSFQHQSCKDFEIVIADDGSGPDIAHAIERHRSNFRYPIQHIRHEHDGFRKTIIINKAVCAAQSEYLVFIDGDCILHHRFIEFHLKRRRVGTVLSGRRVMLNPQASAEVAPDLIKTRKIENLKFWWGRCNPRGHRHGIFLPGAFWIRNLRERKRCDILGCNFSVHKSDFLKVNGYDERIIGRGMEDDNLSVRFSLAGIPIKSVAHEALQYHFHHSADPIPHTAETIAEFRDNVSDYWTPHGIIKRECA